MANQGFELLLKVRRGGHAGPIFPFGAPLELPTWPHSFLSSACPCREREPGGGWQEEATQRSSSTQSNHSMASQPRLSCFVLRQWGAVEGLQALKGFTK